MNLKNIIPNLAGILLAAVLYLHAAPGLAAGGTFSIENGYYQLSGSDGLVTSLALDHTGEGNYDANTIKPGSYCAFMLDGTLLQSASATYAQAGDTLTIANLPNAAMLTITLDDARMEWQLDFSGTRSVKHEWIFDFRSGGFYDRATGVNSSPAVSIDIPFESFYSEVGQNKSFWPVEAFKSFAGYGPQGALGPVLCRARSDRDDSVLLDASALGVTQGQAETENLRLVTGPQDATASLSIEFELRPKTYGATIDGSPIPEFFVEPDVTISPLSSPGTQYSANDLLNEFFQHTSFWWGSNGNIWADWVMRTAALMSTDSFYLQHARNALLGWVVGSDGSGSADSFGYAYTWGARRGWPFTIYDHLDNRHFNNNAIFITALWRYVMWTGDTDLLAEGSTDMNIRIGYADASSETMASGGTPMQAFYDDTNNYDAFVTLGQTFTATKPMTKIATLNPTWGTTNSGFTLALYTGETPYGTLIAQQTFANVPDNNWNELTFSEQPAGTYYVAMSDPVGTIGWWGHYNGIGEDLYPGGEGCRDGGPVGTMMARARALMNYQQTKLGGATHHLITLGPSVSGHHQGRGYYRTGGIVDVQGNWYDMLPFGYQDLFANINYYESLGAMADLEELMGNAAKAQEYRDQLPLTRDAFSTALYRSGLDAGSGISASRFIACRDVDGVDHDFGYAGLNCWAVAAGLATQTQAEAIYQWLDNGKSRWPGGSWVDDIYDRFDFAPRGSTIYNNLDHGSESWWRWETAPWNIIQNGGTSLHEAGYDIEARAKYLGGDDAWARLSTMLSRYADPDRMCMDTGYYGEIAQGGRPSGNWVYGNVGWMFAEFPETCVAGSAFLYGFLGAEIGIAGLTLTPHVPTTFDAVGARNIFFRDAQFDFRGTSSTLMVSCRENPNNQWFRVGERPLVGTFSYETVLVDGSLLVAASEPGPPEFAFDIDDYLEGWEVADSISDIQVQDNLLQLSLLGFTPRLESPSLSFAASERKYLHLRLRNESRAKLFQLYWITDTQPNWHSSRTIQIPITPDEATMIDYQFDLSSIASWDGTITGLRLELMDPGNITSGPVAIDHLAINNHSHALAEGWGQYR